MGSRHGEPRPTAGPGRTLRLAFSRGPGPDFSDRDRDLLTARHWELLHLVAAGHTNAQIARRLGISEATVRTHLEHIYRLLQVSSRAAAVTRAFTAPTA